MKTFTDIEFAKSFHGHLGPNLVIGNKLGNRAIAALSPESCFQLTAEVHCPEGPPVSCVIDGIQLSTGCTMGKKNIRHVVAEDGVKVVFTNTANGRPVTLCVEDGFIRRASGWIGEFGEEEASRMTWDAPDGEVFTECSTQ